MHLENYIQPPFCDTAVSIPITLLQGMELNTNKIDKLYPKSVLIPITPLQGMEVLLGLVRDNPVSQFQYLLPRFRGWKDLYRHHADYGYISEFQYLLPRFRG